MKIKDLQKERVLRSALFVLLLNVVGMTKGYAYDFSAVCPTGQTLYYNITDVENHYVELTCPGANQGNAWNGYINPTGNIILPDSVEYDDNVYSVTSIGNYAFSGCSGLTDNLTIPNSVTSIGNGGFKDCIGLTSLTIGDFVTTIGNSAFSNCKYLTSVTIGNSVTTIDYSAFSGCSDLISMTIPNSVTSIGNYTFNGCSSLASLTIGSSVTSLGFHFLQGCNNLTSLTILADNPPVLSYNYEFYNTLTNTIIYVPCGSVGLYQSTNGWSVSQNITGMCAPGTITVAADPLEGGTVVGGGTYEGGTPCTVIATANDGYTFMYWTENNTVVSAQPEYGFAVPTNRNLVAHFTMPLNVNVVANPTEGGTVTGTGEYDYGSICTVTSTPNENYTFMYWTKNGTQISTQPTCSFKVTSDSELEANFALPFNVTATTNMNGCGTISGTGEYDYGSYCTLTATPYEGYLFMNWSKNGEVVSCNASYNFSVTEDIILEAVFMELYYGVLVNETGSGTTGWFSDLPFCSYSNYTLSQQIYTSDEIGEIGSISSISFINGFAGDDGGMSWGGPEPWDKGSLFNTEYNTRNLDIYMVYTDKTVFNSNTDWIPVTEADLVFSGSINLIPGYWTTIFLDSVFYYNGTSNLAIIVDDNTGGYTDYSPCRVFGTQNNQTIRVYCDGTNYDPSNPSLYEGFLFQEKNQIIFNAPSWYHIGASWNIGGGTVEGGAQDYPPLTTCTLTATPNDGYVFLNWTENDQIVSTDASYSFVVVGSRYLMANFGEITNHWTPNENDYEDNMTFTCIVQLDGVEQRTTMLEVGAFCGEECRGSQMATYFAPTDHYIYQMIVFGEGNDAISFRLYDHQLQQELPLSPPASVTFNSNGYGSLSNPYVLNFTSAVEHTQALNSGWNWWSTYIELNNNDGLSQLENSIGSAGILIKSRNNGYVEAFDYNGETNWYGTLSSINNEQMYKIRTNAECNATVEGWLANPADHPVIINNGWNWIGFPYNQNVSVDVAMSGFTPENNDIIKSRNGYTTYYSDCNYNMWYGTLNTFEPGKGYMYRSNSAMQKILVFTTGRGDGYEDNITPENNVFRPADRDFADNMAITAVLELDGEELRSEDYELAAFVGDECRGSVRLMYVEPFDRYIAFLTIFGEQEEELYFQLTDGVVVSLSSDQLAYVVDGVLGTLDNPVVLHFEPMDVEENASANVKVYPNPSDGIFNIEGQNIRKVEVFNAFGQPVFSEETGIGFMKLDLTNRAAGVYLIRIVTDGGIWSHQIIRK